jgi:cold shock CspA family protein
MQSGYISYVNLDAAFGFIVPDGCRPREADIFFHRNDLPDAMDFDNRLQEMRVTFDLERGPKGLRARNVRRQPD